ncbi:MAG: glycoside hydrolase family 15 protein [Gammaproteobacteria bacterium]|nr:glycoside hydrolase family 15 protein [Gammaproteobacteria bacterium]
MPSAISDYALIGNTRTAALVGRDGSIDWLCLPRFDSGACFAALLGGADNGRWQIAPAVGGAAGARRYRDGTLVLETEFETGEGRVRVVDCMPPWPERDDVVRLVEGIEGRVRMRMELVVRFDYGAVVPWVRRYDGGRIAVAGPDALHVHGVVPMRGERFRTVAEFSIDAGASVPFVLSYFPSHREPPLPIDAHAACARTTGWWRAWGAQSEYNGHWADAVHRSLITLKALTYAPTGGMVAAPTTSLPETPGGARNWDYRYCWMRDATFTLYALLIAGYRDEACAWREWLLRVAAGRPGDLQIMYGIGGERRLPETILDWLPGYAGAAPVRIGNAASAQLQLDVCGEVMDALHLARRAGIEPGNHAWDLQRALMDFLESNWERADNGIWEVRGPRRHFTHSKVMAWVAADRAVKAVEQLGLEGPATSWRGLRDRIHAEVCRRGFDTGRGCFVQSYGSTAVDASLLLLPLVGFLPATDARMRATVAAIERELVHEGFVHRYLAAPQVDGLTGEEGAFLPCSFWLVDNYALQGRTREAESLFERLLGTGNDLGLFAEEYDPHCGMMLGNFPQALTHVALINSARNLSRPGGPCEHRGGRKDEA